MPSNKESSRRSKKMTQAHLTELETLAAQLRAKNASLNKRLADINQKYNEEVVDNIVLTTNVETMRAKVKLAEERVKRVFGFVPMVQPVSHTSTMGPMTSYSCSSSDTSTNTVVPVQDDVKPQLTPPAARGDVGGTALGGEGH